jgi:hypothetical protein
MCTKFRLQSLKGEGHSVELDVDGKIILEGILGKYSWRVWIGFVGSVSDFCEHGAEHLDSIKGGNLLIS